MHRLREYATQTTLAAIQSLIILYAILSTLALMKALGYPDSEGVVWFRPLAVFIRHYGLVLLILPGVWVWLTIELENGSTRFTKRWSFVSGTLMIGILLWILWPVATQPGMELGPIRSAY